MPRGVWVGTGAGGQSGRVRRLCMGFRKANYPCEACGTWTTHLRPSRRLNHGLHAALTVVTFGLWGLVWLYFLARKWYRGPEPWRCARCGEPFFA